MLSASFYGMFLGVGCHSYLPEVKSRPLTPPNVENETNTGMIQAITPYTLSANVCNTQHVTYYKQTEVHNFEW